MAQEDIKDVLSHSSRLASYNMVLQDEEPLAKIPRLDGEPKPLISTESPRIKDVMKPIPILGDDMLPTENALSVLDGVAVVLSSKKHTQQILKYLTEKLPLLEMAHVKRVRAVKNDISNHLEILLIVRHKSFEKYEYLFHELASKNGSEPSLNDFIQHTIPDFGKYIGKPLRCKVPSKPPLTRQQFELSKKYWPVAFHEDKRISKLITGDIFSSEELDSVGSHMQKVINIVEKGNSENTAAAIIVNPRTDKIVATACDLSLISFDFLNTGNPIVHPLQHAVMVAIDLVAKSHGGGEYHYPEKDGIYFNENMASEPKSISRREPESDKRDVPYICTGYDAYLSHEPCVMCSMALLHSRIRRVFYSAPNPQAGGLGGKYKLHTVKELNHRFDVFKCNL